MSSWERSQAFSVRLLIQRQALLQSPQGAFCLSIQWKKVPWSQWLLAENRQAVPEGVEADSEHQCRHGGLEHTGKQHWHLPE